MELRQKMQMRKLLLPELRQHLQILALPLPDLKDLLEQELVNNPFLEEAPEQVKPASPLSPLRLKKSISSEGLELRAAMMTRHATLQDVLLRQLGMFADTENDRLIGREIIGNIDENGYLKNTAENMAATLGQPVEKVVEVLKLVQRFEPPGVGARSPAECLLIQLELGGHNDPVTRQIVEAHLEDLAKKNYTHIAKCLKEPLERIEPCIKKILKLNPKPGRNYSAEEHIHVVPDILIDEGDEDDLLISINNEDTPTVNINQDYKKLLKDPAVDAQTKTFLREKLHNAMELLRAISRRQTTLRKVVEVIVEIQQEAIMEGFARLKPLTFHDVAARTGLHESTICRVVMNKYCQTPHGVVALKDFFSSHVHDTSGQTVSSNFVKRKIKELIDAEDKKHPLSDSDITKTLASNDNLKLARRTVAKYREELKILSSPYRRIK